jgi:uncharacterized protein YgbK (DUF1537 family)
MQAIRVLADDLTGACDVGSELLPWPGGVGVRPSPDTAGGDVRPHAVWVRNTQSRTAAPDIAAGRVRAALDGLAPGWAGLVLKKIDSGLRGPLGAEIDAVMDGLGLEEAFVLPAIPEMGRTTQHGRQLIGGVPVHLTPFARDPQNPIRDASVPGVIEATSRRRAAVVGLGAVRNGLGDAVDAARAAGASILVCDAESDADLERAVRGLLRRTRPLLLVGSTGLARALRRVLAAEHDGRARPRPAGAGFGVLVVAGSAHPTTRGQIERAAARGFVQPLEVESAAAADAVGLEAGALLRAGRTPVLLPPAAVATDGSAAVLAALRRAALASLSRVRPGGLVLIGGETAYQVLEGLGHPPLWLEARLCPLVVRTRLMAGPYGGLALVTKGGSTGSEVLLGAIVRQLGRSAR